MDVFEALGAESGVVAVVGAGGKKTTLYTLAERTRGDSAHRAVVTATVRIPIFDRHVETVVVTDDPVTALERTDAWPVGVVPEREREDRYVGYDPAIVDDLAAADAADLVLVKADGARTREFKAPGDDEPQLPQRVDTVIPIASVHAVGKPLSAESVHRPERVAAITGLELGDPVRPEDVSRVLTSDRGGLNGVPDGATVVPLLNKVDDPDRRAIAEEIATGVLERAPRVPRVVLARMIADEPVVDVLER
ncbi:selenium cofactor biosynthesis protein YqeC [Natrinema longum]|uniref:Putative selenium-dependent hydroxylase accessory protein YqeC n=1 Tax=Natrinema longum TaxID=370324 RepID=A0A8A2UCW8_9EURY|nr:selenium cofactor biosynthesis protein YqeC [Natrinema longum]MBZ6496361.1 putative selenium-dependent hydroxylase accessory protein YqeC [Natrinema longum]QSW85728.1 putative selenium-dependent hydroxylase accessory protein YqeC [Natrinema longum]